ncbi:hypothetical protein FOA43_000521 [Brettanomyces nanus]|uniref:Isopentenyl-diphosphate Delta-isomerase n=1 Tax=Eeniella nana TaxID=13502 RepID=A0A875S1C5_EENNA|nr:uncharacterized protein FOA43_000521 [Brettanomyces nanus]QPG73214.1 hypothetical protein FOA43_000521 [Brettanomyces nanus]
MTQELTSYHRLVKYLSKQDILDKFLEVIPLERTTGEKSSSNDGIVKASSTISATGAAASSLFAGHDEEQIRLMAENCIVLDYNDVPIGSGTKKLCHIMKNIDQGLLHRAFSVFLFDSHNRLLLQQRADEKITFPSMWTNTCCSHPLCVPSELGFSSSAFDGTNIHSLDTAVRGAKSAAQRKLDHELGISNKDVPVTAFKFLTRIHYMAPSNGAWGEHEIDYILIIKSDGQVHANTNEVKDYKYVTKQELKQMFNRKDLLFTPWFKLICESYLYEWWDHLDNLKNYTSTTIDRMLNNTISPTRAVMTLDTFNFHLLRVTLAQLMKTHGYDRSNNRALDVMTDLCTKYLRLLTSTVLKYTELRNATEPNIQDLTDAFLELKLISPATRLDAFDIDRLTSKGMENFESWFMSEMNTRLREVARPDLQFVQNAIHEKKLKDVNSKMSTLTAALDQQAQQAQQQNPTLPYQYQPSQTGLSPMRDTRGKSRQDKEAEHDDLTVDDDWVKFILRQQLNENPDLKFNGTVLINYLPKDKLPPKRTKPCRDFIVAGPTPNSLTPALPYSGDEKRLLNELRDNDIEVDMNAYERAEAAEAEGENAPNLTFGTALSAQPTHKDFYPQVNLEDDPVQEDSGDHSLNLFG